MTKYVILSLSLWILPFIYGLLTFDQTQHINNSIVLNEGLKVKISNSAELKILYTLFVDILTHNSYLILINLLGVCLIGIPTIINLIYNGLYTSLIFGSFYNSGYSIPFIFNRTISYCFLELSGIWISGAVGLFGISFFLGFIKDLFPKKCETKVLAFMAFISLILIIIAAFIEALIIFSHGQNIC